MSIASFFVSVTRYSVLSTQKRFKRDKVSLKLLHSFQVSTLQKFDRKLCKFWRKKVYSNNIELQNCITAKTTSGTRVLRIEECSDQNCENCENCA